MSQEPPPLKPPPRPAAGCVAEQRLPPPRGATPHHPWGSMGANGYHVPSQAVAAAEHPTRGGNAGPCPDSGYGQGIGDRQLCARDRSSSRSHCHPRGQAGRDDTGAAGWSMPRRLPEDVRSSRGTGMRRRGAAAALPGRGEGGGRWLCRAPAPARCLPRPGGTRGNGGSSPPRSKPFQSISQTSSGPKISEQRAPGRDKRVGHRTGAEQ